MIKVLFFGMYIEVEDRRCLLELKLLLLAINTNLQFTPQPGLYKCCKQKI